MTAEELERFRELMERANRELEERNELSKETRDELAAFNEGLSRSAKDTTKTLDRLGSDLTRTFSRYNRAISNSERGVGTSAKAVGGFVNSLGTAAQTIPVFGTAISAATKAVGSFISAVGEQSDIQYETYTSLQRFGAAAEDGLEGVQKAVFGLNLTLAEADKMVQMIGQNAPSLALFQDTVSDSRDELANLGHILKSEGIVRDLMLLGMKSHEVSEALVGFVALQSEVGDAQRLQRRGNLELANATSEYLKEMNAITKATGIEREQLEEKIRSMREEERFRAYTATLRARGDDELARRTENLMSQIETVFGADVAKGIRDVVAGGGAITSPEAQKAFMSMQQGQEGVQQIARSIATGDFTRGGVMNRVARDLGATAEEFREEGRLGVLERSDAFFDFATLQKALVRFQEQDYTVAEEKARDEQAGQIETPEANVRRAVEAVLAQIGTTQAQEDIKQSGMILNEAALLFDKSVEKFSDIAADMVGAGTRTPGAGGTSAQGQSGGQTGSTGGLQPPTGGGIGGSAQGRATGRTIADLVSRYSKHVGSGEEVTISDLIKNSDMASQIASYMGVGTNQPMMLDADTIGKIVLGQKGVQMGGDPSDGERYRAAIRRSLLEEFGTGSIEEFRQGGIATGPRSGYLAELHGTEAIVPLSSGSIPVTISNLESQISGPIQQLSDRITVAEDLVANTATQQPQPVQSNSNNADMARRTAEQMSVMREQITRLDRLIQVNQSNNNIMSKILQNSYA